MYVALGRHTLIPVTIMILCQIPVYLGLCITWRTLRGTPPPLTNNENGNIPASNLEGMEHHQRDEDVIHEKDENVDIVEKPMYIITTL